MKAIVNTGAGRLEWREGPLPEPGPGQVRIKTVACGICATDLEMIAGWKRTSFPAIPGHEWSGQVDAVGAGADAALVGCRCVAENVLADGGEVGFEHPGGYAEYFVTEARHLQVLPADFPPATAALIEPLAVCIRAGRRLRLADKAAVLVFGDGPIGLLMVLLMARAGAEEVTLVGGRAGRLKLAEELGAGRTLNYHACGANLAAAIRAACRRDFPGVIEASGSAAALAAGMELAAPGGKVLIVGDYKQARANFDWNLVLLRELELIGSNASAQAWPEAVRLAQEIRQSLTRLITHEFPAREYASAFDLLNHNREAIKVILRWDR